MVKSVSSCCVRGRRVLSNPVTFSGFTKFAPLSILDDPKYVKDDVMFIKATVHVDI